MSDDKKYPIAATCQECKEDVWVYIGKDSGEEYLTDEKNVRNKKPIFHGCYKSKWKPRDTSAEVVPEKIDQTKIPAKAPLAGQPIAPQRGNELLEETLAEEAEEFETADSRMIFDRTHKLVEISLSKTRKCHNKTITQLPEFESLEYWINGKIEVELGADFQQIVREKFADISIAIAKEMEQDRMRLEGLKK